MRDFHLKGNAREEAIAFLDMYNGPFAADRARDTNRQTGE